MPREYSPVPIEEVNDKKTEESQEEKRQIDHVIKVLDYKKLDDNLAGLLDLASPENHQYIANRLIEEMRGRIVVGKLELFKNIDRAEVARRLIETRNAGSISYRLEEFPMVDRKELLYAMIDEASTNALEDNIGKFDNLDSVVAESLINKGGIWLVAKNLEKFEGVDHAGLLNKLKGQSAYGVIASNLEMFKGINHQEELEEIIKRGHCGDLLFNGSKDFLSAIDFSSVGIDEKKLQEIKDIETFYGREVQQDFCRELNQLLQSFDYTEYIYPILKSQGPSVAEYLKKVSQISATLRRRKITNENSKGFEADDMRVLTGIAKRYGTEARNIVELLIMKGVDFGEVASVATEGPQVNEYIEMWENTPIINYDIYIEYKKAKEAGNSSELELIKEECSVMQDKVFRGMAEEEDFENKYYNAVSYAVFPPAIGITAEQYALLNKERQDQNQAIEEFERLYPEFKELQFKTIEVPTGRYELQSGESLDLSDWRKIQSQIAKVNKEHDKKRLMAEEAGKEYSVEPLNVLDIAYQILEIYNNKSINNAEDREWLIEKMYRLYVQEEGGRLPDSFSASRESLMEYKMFIGDRVKNDLIKLCVKELEEKDPERFNELSKDIGNRHKKNGQNEVRQLINRAKGLKNLEKRIKNEEEDEKKIKLEQKYDTALNGVEDLVQALSEGTRTYEDIKEMTAEDISTLFKKEEMSDSERVFHTISLQLAGSINHSMYKEIDKFKFEAEAKKNTKKLQLIYSKKKVYGVAGYTQGKCVTSDKKLWEDESFLQGIILDPETKTSAGGFDLLKRTIDGSDSLVLVDVNPSMKILGEVDNDILYKEIVNHAKATRDSFQVDTELMMPENPGIHSNQQPIQKIILGQGYATKKLNEEQIFSTDPYPYSFKEVLVID